MRKQRNRPPKNSKSKSASSNFKAPASEPNRRSVLRLLRNAAIAAPIIAGAGYYTVSTMNAAASEADLSKIGNGRPAIVQIHDPNCSMCRALQGQTREILGAYEDDKFEYLVANIKTQEGSLLAVKHGVPHVTLLLFDAKGEMIQAVRGPIRTPILSGIIADHMRRYG